MSPVYLNVPPSSSSISFLEPRGDQHNNLLLGQLHDHRLVTCNNSSISYDPNLDKNHTFSDGSCLTIGYSGHAQNEVEKFWSLDKPRDLGHVFLSATWPENTRNGTSYTSNYRENEDKVVERNVDHKYSKKWKPSKVKITQKMMTSKISEDQKPPHHHDRLAQRQYRNHIDNGGTIRMCSDCRTTTTPLWRSGPQGPKSLCNACGIRQRKARRAAMAAAAAAAEFANNENGVVVAPVPMEEELKPQVQGLQEQEFNNYHKTHPLPLKKRGKTIHYANNFNSNFQNAVSSSTNNNSRTGFPRDEEEGAILLMALSCGLACSS